MSQHTADSMSAAVQTQGGGLAKQVIKSVFTQTVFSMTRFIKL